MVEEHEWDTMFLEMVEISDILQTNNIFHQDLHWQNIMLSFHQGKIL